MTTLYFIAFGATALLAAAVWLTHAWRRRDAIRRASERNNYRLRREAQKAEVAEAAVATIVDRYFPFAKDAWRRVGARVEARERLRQALASLPGVVLGTTSIEFPALLSFDERVKGVLIVGRTGGGKTTIQHHLLVADLLRGVAVFAMGSESEAFRDWALGFVPESRIDDVIYFRPADVRCGLVWNPICAVPGVDPATAAGQRFVAIKRALGEVEIGARADAILFNVLLVISERDDASLMTLVRFLEDDAYRGALVERIRDPYLKTFWTTTYPQYPAGAALPILTRMQRFLRVPRVRSALCGPVSTVSLHDALSKAKIVYFDLGGLDAATAKLVSFLALATLQIELFRRDSLREEDRGFVGAFVDELHFFADSAEGSWRELSARGRRHGLGMVLGTQSLAQLPRSLASELSSNCSSLISVGGLSAKDAASLRKEFVIPDDSGGLVPVEASDLIASRVGEGLARLGTGSCALHARFSKPIPRPDSGYGRRVQEASWKNFAAPPVFPIPQPIPSAARRGDDELLAAGRGGARHKLLQRLAREWGEARGFRATIEAEILAGAGRIDVSLAREDFRVAVEVAVVSTPMRIAASVTKAFAANFDLVAVLFADDALRQQHQQSVLELLDAKDRPRTKLVDADGLQGLLDGLPSPPSADRSAAGYKVHVEAAGVPAGSLASRRRTLARIIGTALLRSRSYS